MNYIHQRKGRAGYYGQRKVPKELQKVIGTSCWMRKLGTTKQEAVRNLPQFLEETNLLLAVAKGDVDPVRQIRSLLPEDLKGLSAHEVVADANPKLDDHIKNEKDEWVVNPAFEELYDIVKAKQEGTYRQPRTKEDLIKLATSLKQPAASTVYLWETHLTSLMEAAGREYITDVTEEDVLEYRAKQLQRVQSSTLRTRLRFIRGLFELAKDQKWIDSNPADGSTKHLVVKKTVKKVVPLDQADKDCKKLPEKLQLLWHLCRWTGAHISEVAGLRGTDIDLKAGVIHLVPHEIRPLKNIYRQRVIPIHSKLRPILRRAKGQLNTDELVFPWAYNPERARWCEGVNWKRSLGVTPKATRDWAATCLREKGVNEKVIGVLFGHAPTSITEQYGAVTQQSLVQAIELLR